MRECNAKCVEQVYTYIRAYMHRVRGKREGRQRIPPDALNPLRSRRRPTRATRARDPTRLAVGATALKHPTRAVTLSRECIAAKRGATQRCVDGEREDEVNQEKDAREREIEKESERARPHGGEVTDRAVAGVGKPGGGDGNGGWERARVRGEGGRTAAGRSRASRRPPAVRATRYHWPVMCVLLSRSHWYRSEFFVIPRWAVFANHRRRETVNRPA